MLINRIKSRAKLIEYIANMQPCTIAIEACGGAHYWARKFISMGHQVKMMAPQFVKPYVMSNKNDRNDAKAIAEAATRPNMKFVPVKTIEQQEILLLHRSRELFVKQRTAIVNHIRGLLSEFGVVIDKGIKKLNRFAELIEQVKEHLTPRMIEQMLKLYENYKKLDQEVEYYEKEIKQRAKEDPVCNELMKIEGVGPLIASAAVATIGDAKAFKNGREVAAFLGLVPKQHSSGNKIQLGSITKRGDRYLRKLLVQGARTIVLICEKKDNQRSAWVLKQKERGGFNKAAVALANKNARIIWAIMATGECYRKSPSIEKLAV